MKKQLLFISFFSFIINLSFSQVQPDEIRRTDRNGDPKLIRLKATRIAADTNSVKTFLRDQYQVGEDTDFQTLKNYALTYKGLSGQKYQQYYKGIKVEFSIINTVSQNNNLHVVNGDYLDIKQLNTTPQLSEAQALEAAKTHIGAESYMWEDEGNNQFLRQEQNDPDATFFPKGELVIIEKDMLGKNPTPVLVYRFDIYASRPLSRNYVYIDAQNGEVVFVNAMIHHADGIAHTRYSGQRTIQTEQIGSRYWLRDITRGSGIETYDMNGNADFKAVVNFVDDDNTWSIGEYDNPEMDNAALDAHRGAAMTYDYFDTQHNRDSYDNNGGVIRNYVHADLVNMFGFGSNNNATWDGQRAFYGDGNMDNGPWTSLDMVAHEIAHGVCQAMVPPFGLIYVGESGAINEGLSDIWGAMVEFSADPTKDTYIIGEDFTLSGDGIRSMQDPNTSNPPKPDTYQGNHWEDPNCVPAAINDNCGVHTNSSVLNHWFYLLAEGGMGVNDNTDAYDVTGIGKTNAAAIVYLAESLYFTPSTNYTDARYLTLQAAADLYGEDSTEYTNVYNAWYAVGIGDEFITPPELGAKLGNTIIGEDSGDRCGHSVSLNSDGSIVAIGAIFNDGGFLGYYMGHTRIYQFDGVDTWNQLGQEIYGEADSDASGRSVSLNTDGTIVAIGATGNDDNGSASGHVRIYEFDGVDWNQIGQDIDGEAADDQSGRSVSLNSSGNRVAIGAPYNDGNTGIPDDDRGHVRVYEFDGVSWSQLGQDIDGEATDDWSGWSVSLSSDGSIVAIGAFQNDGNTGNLADNRGHVRIYQFDGVSWNQLGQDVDGEADNDASGYSVSLNSDGNRIAVGARYNDGNTGIPSDNRGHVRVYDFDGVNWIQVGLDIDGDSNLDRFGSSVSLSSNGNRLAIGAPRGGINERGRARIYSFDGIDWVQFGPNINPTSGNSTSFGDAISISSNGNRMATGAPHADTSNGDVSGYVWVNDFGLLYYTAIPDSNFEQALIDQGIDSEGILDGQVLTSDISGITNLLIPSLGISDLTGIEDFAALEVLTCSDNNLSGLYVGHNVNLTTLHCDTNQINNLDLRENVNLTVLTCSANELIGLDLSNNINLVTLFCHDNNLLNSLDLTGLALLENVELTLNPNLDCIQVDNAADANAGIGIYNNWNVDAIYSEDCNDFYFTAIPDPNFELALANLGYDNKLGDNQVPRGNISGITDLDVSGNNIMDLTGIEDFTALQALNCNLNNLTALDVSNNSNLEELRCIGNDIASLNINGLTSLTALYCSFNQLTNLDVSLNQDLVTLWCDGNLLTDLDVSTNTSLTDLRCNGNGLTNLTTNGATNLEELRCADNQLTVVDLSNNNNLSFLLIDNNPELTFLDCSYAQLSEFNMDGNSSLTELYCANNLLETLNLEEMPNLSILSCSNNQLTNLDVSQNVDLTVLWCNDNLLEDLNIEENIALNWLDCSDNLLTSLEIQENIDLTDLDCSNNQLRTLDVTQNPNLEHLDFGFNQIATIDLSSNTILNYLDCSYNQLQTIDVTTASELTELYCQANNLMGSLLLSSNSLLAEFNGTGNSLTCIEVTEPDAASAGMDAYASWLEDFDGIYSSECEQEEARGVTGSTIKDTKYSSEENPLMVNDIILYPNPVSDEFYIAVPAGRELSEAVLYNLKGEQLLHTKSTHLSTQGLAEGMYFVEIQLTNGERIIKKVIVFRE